MRPSVGKHSPRPHNSPLYRALSFILSTALVMLPILPAGIVRASAPPRRVEPAEAVRAAPFAPPVMPLAPSITATKVDSFPDPDGDNKAEPGQTITYTVTITNSGPDDATNVQFNDTVDPNTTLVPGSVQTQPRAADDTYNVLGNVRIQPNAASGLLANDTDPDTGNNTGLTATGPSASAQGGEVTINSDGSFSYNPPPGFEGTDTFTYTVTDGTTSDTATVTLNVNEVVWFINNTAPAGGDGRLTSPYNSLASVNGADLDEPGDVIFVYEGAGLYDGGIVLEAGQRLVGQGTSLDSALTLFGISAPPHSDARPAATSNPTLANSGGNVVTLAGGNTVIYLNASATAAGSSAISGSAAGATTVSNVGASASGTAGGVSLTNQAGPFTMSNSAVVSNSSGTAVLVSGGAAAISFNDTDISQNGGRVVNVQSRMGGAVTFDAASSVSGTNGTTDAVSLLGNTGGAVTFAGPVQLNTIASGARGLVADSGIVNLTNGGNTVSATGAAAVDIENLAANISFATTLSTNSTGRGLRVDSVSGAASFGNTAVNNSTNTGVLLTNNSAAVSFIDLDLAPAAGVGALDALNNTGVISSASGSVTTTNATVGINVQGTGAANRTPLNVRLTSVSTSGGTNGISLQSTSSSGSPGGFRVLGAGGNCNTGDPTCTGGTIQTAGGHGVNLSNVENVALDSVRITTSADSGIGGIGVHGFALNNVFVTANGNSVTTDDSGINLSGLTGTVSGGTHPTSITNSTISNNFEFQIQVLNGAGAGTLSDLQMSGNSIAGNGATAIANLVNFLGTGSSTMRLSVVGGSFTGNAPATAAGLNCDSAGTGTVVCNASGATFVNNNVGVSVSQSAGGNVAFDLSGNTATGNRSHALSLFLSANSTGTSDGQFVNNIIGTVGVVNSGSNLGIGIRIQNESSTAGSPPVNVLVSGNTVQQLASFAAVNVIQGLAGQPATRATNVTATNNTLRNVNGNRAIIIQQNNLTVPGSTCADISGNEMNNISGSGGDGSKLRLVQRAGGTFNVRQTSLADLAAANSPPNGVATTTTTTAQISVAGTLSFGGGACAQPTLPSLSMFEEHGAPQQFLAATDTPAPQAVGASAMLPSLDKVRSGFANAGRPQALTFGAMTGFAQPAALKAAPVAAPAALAGETININIGTLKAGDSVTITFQVTVADPFPTNVNPAQVSNQGVVTADGGINVLTDDPSEVGSTNPTVTPILTPPLVNINDATVAEPASGSTDMLFTVSLSNAYTQTVTVNYQTANGGANPATDGTDYTTSSGTVTFAAGETVKTIAVPVLADGTPSEGNETFLVNLSGATNSTIGDGQATGTITDESVASQLVISELRTNGTNGPTDEFVELLNMTDGDITVIASDGSGSGWSIVKSGSDCNATPVIVGVVPEGTVIPARGNYLFTGAAYSLGGYATGDAALSADIELNHNVGLFSTANLANIGSANRLDAVGFGTNTGGNCDLLREGDTLGAVVGFPVDYAFVREVEKGLTQDTNDNDDDFIVVDTNGTSVGGGHSQRLGAPGPEGLTNPRGPVPCSASAGAAKFARELIDPTVSAATAPNVVRDNTSNPAQNSVFGTLDFRRTWTNNTGAPVTQLRFRITNLTTFPEPAGTADLRARTSSTIVVSTASGNKTVEGTTLEQPPTQPNGGGINSSLSAGTITLAAPLANGASVNLRFLFGIQQTGDYNVGIVLESLPGSGKDFWKLSGHTENGGHTDGGCNNPPVADAGADITAECDDGQASVTLDGSGSTDPDGDTPLTYEWTEGATVLGTGQTLMVSLPTGSHTITLTVTDPSGDSSQDTVIVNVVDTQAPIISDPPDVIVYTGPGASSCGAVVSDATLGIATASDACEGSLSVNRTGVPAGNVFPVGTTVITYTATDSAGHTGGATQNVTVIDNTPPVISCPANITATFDPAVNGAVVTYTAPTGTDNCAGATTMQTTGLPSGSTFPLGTTVNTFVVTDAAGNTSSCSFNVTVALTSIVGLDSVSFGGASYADSYDSQGGYPATKGSLANVVSNGTITMVGSTKVFGNVRSTQAGIVMSGASHVTGNATAGTTVSRTGSASVGGTITNNSPGAVITLPAVPACGPPYSPNTGISGSYSYNPATGDLNLTGINVATLANGTYCFRNVTLSNSAQLNVNGPVTIKMTGTLTVGGAAKINNTTMIPGNLRILSSHIGGTGVSLGNGSSSYLMIYAPQTGVSISGAGPLFGTVAGKSITLANSGAIHYDTNLQSVWLDIWTLLVGP